MRTDQYKLKKQEKPEPTAAKDPALMLGPELLDMYNSIMTVGADKAYMRQVWGEMMSRLQAYDQMQKDTHSGIILPGE